MKKVSALLLTGIIGSSMLFASFTGTATVTNTLVDLDSANYSFGFANSTEFDASINLYAATGEAMGEGDIYAEINATLSVDLKDIDETPASSYAFDAIDVDFDSANVVGDGWKVSILGVNGPVDYAADTIALDDDDEAYSYTVLGDTAAGVAVTLDDLGTVSVGYTGNFKNLDQTHGYVALEAAEMEVSEGMTAQVAASLAVDKALAKNVEIAGSAKLAYAADDYSASVALDAAYDGSGFGMDAVMNSTMKFVTLDAYFGTSDVVGDFTASETDIAAGTTNLLNVKAVTELADFDVPVTLTLTGLDLVNVQDLDAKAEYALNDELAPYVMGGYVINTKAWSVGAGLTYTVDAYTAAAEVSYDGSALAASASVESTTLVNGATLSLEWDGADDLLTSDLGALTASCSIEF